MPRKAVKIMFKLMKYEFRKMRGTLLVMAGVLVLLEAGFLIGNRLDDYRIAGVSLGLLTALVFAVYIYILIAGISSYSRELNDRTGYMTFMTPVSPIGIVSSKLLFTILAALVTTALFGAAVYLDYSIALRRLNLGKDVYQQFQFAFSMLAGTMDSSITLGRIILNLVSAISTVLISIMLVMCTAYLAITLSATLLQNKKGFVRVLVSFLFFGALNWCTSRVSSIAAWNSDPATTSELLRQLGIQAAVDLSFAVVFAGLSAWLLDKKVDL